MSPPSIDIIIPTYNGASHIARLLESIHQQTYTCYHCFVIDDHSQDNTADIIHQQFPWVRLIEQSKNTGPANNRNIAAKSGNSPYIAFFDDDTFLKDHGWLQNAVSIMEDNPKIGQLASMIVSGYDEEILLDCGISSDESGFGGIFWKKHIHQVLGKHTISRRVLGACSAGTILRRQIFEQIGGFDPAYYYLSEDLDVSIKIHLAGYDVIYEPSLVTHHYESQAMGQAERNKQYLWIRNSLMVVLKHYPARYIVQKFWQLYKTVIKNVMAYCLNKIISPNKADGRLTPFTKHYIQSLPYLCFHLPDILATRQRVDTFRQRPRMDLLTINKHLLEDTSLRFPVKSIIFSITNKCNAQCPMCFQYDDLNKKIPLLTLDEIKKMFWSCQNLENIVLGGGEPFLRKDIDEICYFLIESHNPVITIATNGSFPDVIYEKSKNILAYGCKYLIISLSLDGNEAYHNNNRKIPELFSLVHQSYTRLSSLKKIFGQKLEIQINTCLTEGNIEQLDFLDDYISHNMPEAHWVFEPVRGSFNHDVIHSLSLQQWDGIDRKIEDLKSMDTSQKTIVKDLFRYAIRTLQQETQVVPCCGGKEFISIDYRGNLFPCEILAHPSINIRTINYDINQLLRSPEWMKAIEEITQKKCYCTHFCWLSYSLSKHNLLTNCHDF